MSALGWARGASLAAIAITSFSAAIAAPEAKVPPSRQDAFDAADAALGHPVAPRPIDPSIPTCAAPPPSGTKLAGDMKLRDEGHSVEFHNGGGGDAIVKMRHADSGKLAASFLLRMHEEMTVEGVPDGDYLIQYGFGDALAPDCKSFVRIKMANQLPDVDKLKTTVIDDADHTEVKRMSISYELSVTETANVKPTRINATAFNAD